MLNDIRKAKNKTDSDEDILQDTGLVSFSVMKEKINALKLRIFLYKGNKKKTQQIQLQCQSLNWCVCVFGEGWGG